MKLRALTVLLAALVLTTAARHEASAETVRVAVLPIVVHSAEDPQYLRGGLVDMMTARLERVGGIVTVPVEDASKATVRLRPAIRVGREVGADYVLFGSFTRFGTGASLDMQCASTAPGSEEVPLREIYVHSGNIGEVIPNIDQLVGKVERFMARGGRALGPVAGGPGVAPGGDPAVADLRRRVEALEEALRRSGALSDEPETAALVGEPPGLQAATGAEGVR
ncbi:MAG: hypothetical protein MJE66_24495 [Proteobacteria bacterium]|nr:hypothetical protein [Pseudomonadota bacterium]